MEASKVKEIERFGIYRRIARIFRSEIFYRAPSTILSTTPAIWNWPVSLISMQE